MTGENYPPCPAGLGWERETGGHDGGEGGVEQGRTTVTQLWPHPHQCWSGSQRGHNNMRKIFQ